MDEYSREFRELLNSRLEVPDSKDKEEAIGLLLGNNSDIEEVENICEACTLHLSGDERSFLQEYSQAIDENLAWAKKLDSTHTAPNKKNEYQMLLSLSNQLVSELEEAVGEGKELEHIARRLKDGHLLAEVDYEEDQMDEMGDRLSGLMQRQEKLKSLMSEYENLEDYAESHRIVEALKHRKNVIGLLLEHAEVGSPNSSGPVKVRIPEEFLEQIQGYARNYREEVCGHLLCRKKGNKIIALKMLLSGFGSEETVSPAEAYKHSVNDLIENYSRYRFIDFHTHSVVTVRNNPGVAEDWSKRDRQNFEEQGKGYMGMLITPTKILLDRNGAKANLEPFNKNKAKNFEEWKKTLDEHWKEVASSYSFPDSFDLTPVEGGD